MTQEEKAKAYDEAIERAKDFEKGEAHFALKPGESIVHWIFPELTESEDERIRKWILEKVQGYADSDIPLHDEIQMANKAIAYLEKQKELPFVKDVMLCYPGLYFYDGERMHFQGNPAMEENPYDFAMNQQDEKQKEQKPLTTKEYHDKFDEMYGQYKPNPVEQKPAECGCTNDESEYDKGYREGCKFGLKQTQEYMLPEGKTFSGLIPCWVNAPSELQPAHKYHGKNVVIMHENNGGFRCVCIDDEKPVTFHLPEDTFFVEGWRKKPEEWSEEDETNFDYICDIIDAARDNGITDTKTAWDLRSWLKSLRPRPSWKPSEEQMEALNYAIAEWDGGKRLEGLYALRNDLKKLM